jgi:hypothetical protein
VVVTDKPEGPIQRWSRLKRTQTVPREKTGRGAAAPVPPEEAGGREVAAPTDADQRENSPAPEPPQEPREPQEPDALPDIDSLDKDSDFSVFLRQGVPEEIRRRALRVLWRSDPVLANLDGLNDYDEDFTVVHTVADAVRTAYKVGKGYLDDEEEAKATDQADAAEGTAEPMDPAPSERIAASESDQTTGEGTSTKPDTDTAGEATVAGAGRGRRKT